MKTLNCNIVEETLRLEVSDSKQMQTADDLIRALRGLMCKSDQLSGMELSVLYSQSSRKRNQTQGDGVYTGSQSFPRRNDFLRGHYSDAY